MHRVNFLTGVDEWLHGVNGLHGWGAPLAPDPVLLYVRGFDAAAEQFHYAVNERFGSTADANGGIVAPFQLGFQAHLTLGPDRTHRALRTLFGRRNGAPGSRPAGEPGAGAAPHRAVLRNPVTEILQLRDSLHPSPG